MQVNFDTDREIFILFIVFLQTTFYSKQHKFKQFYEEEKKPQPFRDFSET